MLKTIFSVLNSALRSQTSKEIMVIGINIGIGVAINVVSVSLNNALNRTNSVPKGRMGFDFSCVREVK